jgi:hypothetical protein
LAKGAAFVGASECDGFRGDADKGFCFHRQRKTGMVDLRMT